MNLGIVKELCKERGLTIKETAHKAGLSDVGLYKAINNNKTTSQVIEGLSKVLGCSPLVFFGETDKATFLGIANFVNETTDISTLTDLIQVISCRIKVIASKE